MAKWKKCKSCGRNFIPKEEGEEYCSALCQTTGHFLAGGGDRTKPKGEMPRKRRQRLCALEAAETKPHLPKKYELTEEQKRKVESMFLLPTGERWSIAKTFTPEEHEYANKLGKQEQKKEFAFEDAFLNCEEEEEETMGGAYGGLSGGRMGDSDDGTV